MQNQNAQEEERKKHKKNLKPENKIFLSKLRKLKQKLKHLKINLKTIFLKPFATARLIVLSAAKIALKRKLFWKQQISKSLRIVKEHRMAEVNKKN